uniref:Uncharacterized protein n=1 Tax=Candidozyma auris TaxID=498019 RepID=A0A0L0P1P5_CANAR
MASLNSKKVAKANQATLKTLHLTSFIVNCLALLLHFSFKRPATLWPYLLFSTPAWLCECILEKSGRPAFSNGKFRSSDDLSSAGLYEYLFDCIYLTWICVFFMLVFGSNKAWVLYLLLPAFALYKIFTLFSTLQKPQRSQ